MMLPDGILRFGEPPHMNEPLLTAREAGLVLRTHVSTLVRWRKEGVGPRYVQMGNRIMYRESAIEDWLTAHTVTPKPDHIGEVMAAIDAASVRRPPGNLGELIADAFARVDES